MTCMFLRNRMKNLGDLRWFLKLQRLKCLSNTEDEDRGAGAGKDSASSQQSRSPHLHAVKRHWLKKKEEIPILFFKSVFETQNSLFISYCEQI